MAWVSLALVMLLYLAGLDRYIPHQPLDFTLPLVWVRVNFPYSGYIRMFLWTLGVWLALYVILMLLDRSLDLLKITRLLDGLLYPTQPRPVNGAARFLAKWTLIVTAVLFVIAFLWRTIPARVLGVWLGMSGARAATTNPILGGGAGPAAWGGVAQWLTDPLRGIASLQTFIGGLLHPVLPYPIVPWRILILCGLTLVAAAAFRGERRRRYQQDLEEQQKGRDHLPGVIVWPSRDA